MDAAKKVLRARLKAIVCPPVTLDLASAAVCASLASLPAWRAAPCIACYLAMPHRELSLGALLDDAFSRGKRVLLPRVTGPGARDMTMLHVASAAEIAAFPAQGAWGIVEPPEGAWSGGAGPRPDWRTHDLPFPTLIVVPGMGFDARGGRLGHGKGYYDAWLGSLLQEAAARGIPPPLLVGVALDSHVLEEGAIPIGPLDVTVNLVVTPSRVLDASVAHETTRDK